MASPLVTGGIEAGGSLTGALALAYRLVSGRWPMHWAIGALDSSKTESLIS
jgi:fructokinase